MNSDLKFVFVTHNEDVLNGTYLNFIKQVIEGGVTCVQLRQKDASLENFHKAALAFKGLLRPLNIPLIINDSIEIAAAVDADGVHLGQEDSSPDLARMILGNEKIIGVSIESPAELEAANQLTSIDYVSVSAVYGTVTKSDCKKVWGPEGLKWAIENSKHPVMAIGGISLDNIHQITQAGCHSIAVISCLHQSTNPLETACLLHDALIRDLKENFHA